MGSNKYFIILVTVINSLLLVNCGKKEPQEVTAYTATDSLTESYLLLHDSLLATWNKMLQDDNQKIKSMKHLLHELQVTTDITTDEARSLSIRIDQLSQIRYTPKTMWNNDVITEYDFASESLVNELISRAESINSFSYNTTLQGLVEKIRTSDLRVENYRMEYDAIAMRFNQFVEQHKDQLKDVVDPESVTPKPLFQMASQ